jgi:hypothetical protein
MHRKSLRVTQKSILTARIAPSWTVEKTAAEPAQGAADGRRVEILTSGRRVQVRENSRIRYMSWRCLGRIQRRIIAT